MFDAGAVRQLSESLAGDDVGALTASARRERVVALTKLQSLLSLAIARELDRFHTSGGVDAVTGLRADTWLAREAGIPQAVARQLLRTGSALRDPFTDVADAVADGRISFHHATDIVRASNDRIEAGLAAVQDELINLARDRTYGRWRTALLSITNTLDQDGGHDPARDLVRNELTLSETLDGVLHLQGRLVGERAQLFRQAITTQRDTLYRDHRRDLDATPDLTIPPEPTLRALALLELVRRGQAVDLHSSKPAKVEATFVIEASDPTTVTDPGGVRLQDGTVRVLLCEPHLVPIIIDKLGRPLDLGTKVPLATPEQKRAIANRDGGCVFPGCEAPPWWTDAHHVIHRHHLGPTATENLLSLPPPPRRRPPTRLDRPPPPRRLGLLPNTLRRHLLGPTPRQTPHRTHPRTTTLTTRPTPMHRPPTRTRRRPRRLNRPSQNPPDRRTAPPGRHTGASRNRGRPSAAISATPRAFTSRILEP